MREKQVRTDTGETTGGCGASKEWDGPSTCDSQLTSPRAESTETPFGGEARSPKWREGYSLRTQELAGDCCYRAKRSAEFRTYSDHVNIYLKYVKAEDAPEILKWDQSPLSSVLTPRVQFAICRLAPCCSLQKRVLPKRETSNPKGSIRLNSVEQQRWFRELSLSSRSFRTRTHVPPWEHVATDAVKDPACDRGFPRDSWPICPQPAAFPPSLSSQPSPPSRPESRPSHRPKRHSLLKTSRERTLKWRRRWASEPSVTCNKMVSALFALHRSEEGLTQLSESE